MELGGREILIGLGVLLVFAILLDGFRRSRSGNSAKLRVRRRRQPIFDDDDFDEFGAELPGKTRVIEVRDTESAERLSRVMKQNLERNHNKLTTPFRQPEQASLGLDDSERQLLAGSQESDSTEDQRGIGDNGVVPQENIPEASNPATSISEQVEPEVSEQDFIVLHLMASPDEAFAGSALLDTLLDNGLRYGSQKIFHRHEQENGSGKVLFSVTNVVNPGTFELNEMASFSSPGITFFMVMQDSEDPMSAFELLLATVDAIKGVLGGELKDADRSALTRQTAEHYRQQIMDYNRRQLAS